MGEARDIRAEVLCDSRDRETWLRRRTEGIGASEVAIVMGDSPWSSPLELYTRKVTGEADELEGDHIEAGNRLEPIVVEWFRDRSGYPVERAGRLCRSATHPHLLATLDAWTRIDGQWVPLEAKTTGAHLADEWADGPPRHYWWQCQAQCFVHDAPRAGVACLIGGQRFVWDVIERDDAAIQLMLRRCDEFWRRVIDQDPPAPDGSNASSRALLRLHPQDDGEAVVLPGELIDVSDEIDVLKTERKTLDQRIKTLENQVKAAIGDHTRGVLSDGSEWMWSRVDMPERTIKATSFRRLHRKQSKG